MEIQHQDILRKGKLKFVQMFSTEEEYVKIMTRAQGSPECLVLKDGEYWQACLSRNTFFDLRDRGQFHFNKIPVGGFAVVSGLKTRQNSKNIFKAVVEDLETHEEIQLSLDNLTKYTKVVHNETEIVYQIRYRHTMDGTYFQDDYVYYQPNPNQKRVDNFFTGKELRCKEFRLKSNVNL